MMMNRHNPQIAAYVEQGIIDSDLKISMTKNNLNFAFSIEGFMDKETKLDPRYVKAYARLYYHKNGKIGERLLKTHKCTQEEFNRFHPPMADSVGLFDIYRTSKTRHLYCIDWDEYGDDLEVFGNETDDISYQ